MSKTLTLASGTGDATVIVLEDNEQPYSAFTDAAALIHHLWSHLPADTYEEVVKQLQYTK